MAEIAVATSLHLMDYLVNFLHEEVNLPDKVHDGLEEIKSQLKTMQAFLKDTDGRDGVNEVQRDRIRQVRNLAYKIEDVLDEFMFHISLDTHTHRITKMLHKAIHSVPYLKALHDMSTQIDSIQSKIAGFLKLEDFRENSVKYAHHVAPPHYLAADDTTAPYILEEEDAIVGTDRSREAIIDKLINESQPARKIVAVVGTGGSGKSVLTKMVYNDRRIQSSFDCHAWVHINCPFKLDDILLNLLMHLRLKEGTEKLSEEGVDTQHNLERNLGHRKYMIVLDNIWKKEEWEAIVASLPKGLTGSVILIMTRSLPVVEYSYVESPYYIHQMSRLPRDLALELFYKKAFHANDGKCPPELVDLSSQIIDKCEGIPLAIATIGSLLSKKKLPREWKTELDSVGSQLESNSALSLITRTLLPSYNDLPSHLKSCFLYMAIFPEVKRGRLIRSWIAEGFVKCVSGKTLEEVAEGYLNDLIGRNLVQPISIDFDGRLSRCRTTNLVREFIVSKCEENVFLTLLPEANTSSPLQGCRRISLFSACIINMSQTMLNRVRTLFTFTQNIGDLPILDNFKLLRVLDMQDSGLSIFPDQICHLSLLRYLSLKKTNVSTVPDSIQKLTCLETLDLKHTHVTRLPKEIFELRKLRYLFVYSHVEYDYIQFDSERAVEIFPGIGNLTNIEKLSLIKASQCQGHVTKLFKQQGSIIEELGKLVHLRKLGITDLKKEDGEKLCLSITKMKSLSTLFVRSRTEDEYLDLDVEHASPSVLLQRLYLKGCLSTLPRWIRLLHSLVRLGLTSSKLKDNPLDTLQNLPNLIELQMVDAFVGQEIYFLPAKFKKLKILVIDRFEYLNTIVVQEGALSSLKKLIIRRCQSLKMLPLGISYAKKLEKFILYDMPCEFIAKLGHGEDRQSVAHIPVIHSFTKPKHASNWYFLNHS